MASGEEPQRPGTRSGIAGGRPLTGRPTTGRPTTGRPGTSSSRPITRGGTSGGLVAGGAAGFGGADYNLQEYDEEYEEEYEDEDEDEDVFAFVPPDLGPSPALQQNVSTDPYAAQPAYAQAPHEQQAFAEQGAWAGTGEHQAGQEAEEEHFFYDEATGAVYDSSGRLVQLPNGFDPATALVSGAGEEQAVAASQNQSRNSGSTAVDGNLVALQRAAEPSGVQQLADQSPLHGDIAGDGRGDSIDVPVMPGYGSRRAAALLQNEGVRLSLDRKSSNASSFNSVSRDINGPVLSHARSMGGFPSMEVLDEVNDLPSSRDGMVTLPHGQRDIGMTAHGGMSLDTKVPAHAHAGHARHASVGSNAGAGMGDEGMRHRTNRLSFGADNNRSPDSELKFKLDPDDYDDEAGMESGDKFGYMGRSSISEQVMGQGNGLAHPTMDGATIGPNGVRMVELEMEMEEDSPYPEVRASVSNIDDPEMPALTFRMWVLALLLTTISGGANMFFNFRYPAPSVTPVIVQLVAYPLGKLMAKVLPMRTFTTPRWLGSFEFSLNPGAFNIKEHTLISIMANVAIGQAYALNVIIVQDSPMFYNDPRPTGFGILLVLTTQTIGFGLAGVCRRFLVWPASMIWPQNLVIATILNTFHAEEDGRDGTMSRFRFFSMAAIGAFFYYFIPGFLFQALSYMNWVCWIFPDSPTVNALFGSISGLGMSIFTFDWTQIVYIGSPLITPWWAECNIAFGFFFFYWIVAPVVYFKNSWYFAYFPISSSSAFDRYGHEYDVRKVVNGVAFDEEAYRSYSPLYLSTTYTMVYFMGFATISSVLVHTALYHGKALLKGIRHVRTEEDDIHAKFMRHYTEVPDWWYASILLLSFAVSIVVIEVWDTGLPVWGLILSLLIPAIYILPSGFIYAMTGQQIGTNLLGELIPGYVLEGRPLPNMIFKAFSLQGLFGGLAFTQDLKLGHYMKIPPRATFVVQIVGTVWTGLVQVGVKEWMFANVDDLCRADEEHHFTCPHINVFYTASLIWGVIGPRRVFGTGSIYSPVYYALLAGAFIPLPFWYLARRYPKSWVKYVSWPVIFWGTCYIPPATGANYSCWFLVAFIFQYLIRKYNFRWWSKYNFVLSAALDSGTIVSTIFIFFVLNLPKNGTIQLNWWGNSVFTRTADANFMPYKIPPPEGFGPLPHN